MKALTSTVLTLLIAAHLVSGSAIATETENKSLVRALIDAQNSGNLDALDSMVADKIDVHWQHHTVR